METSSKNTVSPTSKIFKDLKTLQENDKTESKSEKISTNHNLKNGISKNISKNDVNQPTPFNQKSKWVHGSKIENPSEKIPFHKHNHTS